MNTISETFKYKSYRAATFALLLVMIGIVGYRFIDFDFVKATVPVGYVTWKKLAPGDPYYNTPINQSQYLQVGDVNGDSLIDVLNLKDGNVALNTGKGYGSGGSYTSSLISLVSSPTFWRPESTHAAGIRVVDVNNDGLVDILQKYLVNHIFYEGVYINTGIGWEKDPRYSIPVYFGTSDVGEYNVPLIDLNGDGLLDIIVAHNNDEFYIAVPAQ